MILSLILSPDSGLCLLLFSLETQFEFELAQFEFGSTHSEFESAQIDFESAQIEFES